jgi:hypothetical protein
MAAWTKYRSVIIGLLACAVLIVVVAATTINAQATAASGSGLQLTKATISDCSTSNESASDIDTSAALLQVLSVADGNAYFFNVREDLSGGLAFPLPTTSYIEKCEFKYNDSGLLKSATMYKSSNDLSTISLSYDKAGEISKVIGNVTSDWSDGQGSVQHDFEVSVVNEKLSSSAEGANKYTVVRSDGDNDTVTFIYDKDKNLTQVKSTGGKTWQIDIDYITAFKVPKTIKVTGEGGLADYIRAALWDSYGVAEQSSLAEEGIDAALYIEPTYDASNKLVSVKTGVYVDDEATLSGDEYEIQYSKGNISKIRHYEGSTEISYTDYKYTNGDLTSTRTYAKGGSQLYKVDLSWS